MKTPRLSKRGRKTDVGSEGRVQNLSQANESENFVRQWLDRIERSSESNLVDANSERSHGCNLELPSQESGVEHPPAQVPKLVNEKWRRLRPKQGSKSQRYRRIPGRSERIVLQLSVESVRTRKLKTSFKKKRPQLRKRRKRRSVFDDLVVPWKATRTLNKNLLVCSAFKRKSSQRTQCSSSEKPSHLIVNENFSGNLEYIQL